MTRTDRDRRPRSGGSSMNGSSRQYSGAGDSRARVPSQTAYHGPTGTRSRGGGMRGPGHRGRGGRGGYPLRSRSINFQGGRNRVFGIDRQLLILGALAVVLLVLVIVGVSSCVRGCSSDPAQSANPVDSRVAAGVSEELTQQFATELNRDEKLAGIAEANGAKGMAWILIHDNGEINSILQKYFTPPQWQALLERLGAENGDFILFCADSFATVCRTLCGLRLEVGDMLGGRGKDDFRFCFVTDFPQFEWSEEEGRYLAMHHPFTMPYEEDLPYLLTDPGRVRSQSYDVVLNGVELGSGSIRIHRSDVQALMFKALGFSEEDARERFGFLIDAFRYGTPPHGGFAFGLDRLVMLLLGADSLRDVIAFPKVKDASCPMTGAPDFVDPAQLEVLKLGVAAGTEEKKREKRRPTMAVRQVAELAKLALSPEEEERMGRELEAVLDFAQALSGLDTQDVPMTAHVIPMENVFREVPAPSMDREALLSCAPARTRECVAVPQTFE